MEDQDSRGLVGSRQCMKPVRATVRIGGGFIVDRGEVAGGDVGPVDLVHLLLHRNGHRVALLGRQQAIVRIPERGAGRRCFNVANIL